MDFEEALVDDAAGIAADICDDRQVTVVAFGGIKGALMMPPFEFFGHLVDVEANRVFLRDHDQAWYQLGVRGLADDADGVAAGLREMLGPERLPHTVFVGASAGGFAALLFGSMLGVCEIQVFAPQTFISPRLRRRYHDGRWAAEIKAMSAGLAERRAYLDVAPSLRGKGRRSLRARVHVGRTRLDLVHAARIAPISGVRVAVHRGGDHAVARHLRDTGQLSSLLAGAVERARRGSA